MLQISLDVTTLTGPQRVALADFILDFPTDSTEVVNQNDDSNNVTIPSFSFASEDDEGPQEDDSEPTPEEMFAKVVTPETASETLDKDGLPWDDRIHSSSRSKNVDGSWRKKRNLDDATVATVEAELKALMGLPSPVAEVTPAAPVITYTSESQVLPPPPPPAVAQVPPPPPPPAPADRKGFIDLITAASSAILAGKITQETLNALVADAGVPSLPLLANRLDLVPQVRAAYDLLVAA